MLRKENAEMKELLARVQKNFRDEMSSLGASMQNAYRSECGSKIDAYRNEFTPKIEFLKNEIQGVKSDAKENKSRFDMFINTLWKQTKPTLSQPCSNGQFNYARSVASMIEAAIKSIGMAN